MVNVLQEEDKVITPLEQVLNIPIDKNKISLKIKKPVMDLSLDEWEKAGLRIFVNVVGLGFGYFNETPYKNIQEAVDKFRNVLEKVVKGDYSLEPYRKNNLKLLLD